MEQEKLNIFYRPNIAPDQSYESVSAFSEIISEEIVEEPKAALDDLIELTKDFIELFSSFKKLPEELGFMLSEINYPILEYLISYTTERIESEENNADELEEGSLNESGSEYEVSADESDNEVVVDSDEEDSLIFTISQKDFKTSVTQAKEAYEDDFTLLQAEYVAQMNQIISKYFIEMVQCTNSIGTLKDSYLLQEIDADAVTLKNEKQRYLKDALVKSQLEKANKMMLFSKTHTQENTLVYLRGIIAANALRKRYCESEVYQNDSSSSSLGTIESNTLIKERNRQDFKYNQSLKEHYKYLKSMSIITGDILNTVTNEAKLKTSLIQSGVDVFKKSDNQATDSSGKTSSSLSTSTSNTSSTTTKSSTNTSNTTSNATTTSSTTSNTKTETVKTEEKKSIKSLKDVVSSVSSSLGLTKKKKAETETKAKTKTETAGTTA